MPCGLRGRRRRSVLWLAGRALAASTMLARLLRSTHLETPHVRPPALHPRRPARRLHAGTGGAPRFRARCRGRPGTRASGRTRRPAPVRHPGRAAPPDQQQERRCAGLVRPGPAHGLRLQPPGRRPGLRRSGEGRSRLRDLLVGPGAGAGAQHQRADGARGRGAGLRCGAKGARAARPGQPGGTDADRRGGGALRAGRAGGSRATRPRLCRRDEGGGGEIPRRRRRAGDVRRSADGPDALGLLDRQRPSQPGNPGAARGAGKGAAAQPRPYRRDPLLHPRHRGLAGSQARRATRRPPRGAGARRRAPGPHARAHLPAPGPLPRCGADQPQGHRRGRDLPLVLQGLQRGLPAGLRAAQLALHRCRRRLRRQRRNDPARGAADRAARRHDDARNADDDAAVHRRAADGAGALRALGRDPGRAGTAGGVAVSDRDLAFRARARVRGQGRPGLRAQGTRRLRGGRG